MKNRGIASAFRLGSALVVGVVVVVVLLLASKGGDASAQPGTVVSKPSYLPKPLSDDGSGDAEGWQTVFTETFESGIGSGWTVTDTSDADGGEFSWGAGSFTPTSAVTAAWCVGGGADGSSLTPGLDDYPNYVDSWLIYGPIDLDGVWDAYVRFSWWMDGSRGPEARRGDEAQIQRLETVDAAPDEGDWLGWCALTDPGNLEGARCSYVSSGVGSWMRGVIPLDRYLRATPGVTEPVWFAFRFVSDGDGQVGAGAFVDDVELRVNRGYRTFLPLASAGFGVVEWNYPVITEGGKIGIHAITGGEWVEFPKQLVDAGTHFPVVKAVDHWGWVFDVAQESPETIFIGRKTWPGGEGCQGVGDPGFDMEKHARLAIQRIRDVIEANDGLEQIIDYWEPYNEPDPNEPTGVEGHQALAHLMIETMEEAEKHGLKIALFSFNAGAPEWDEMEAIVETGVFARARAGGHILAVHEGTFVTHDPKAGWGSTIPGSPVVPGAGALNFRYRYLYYLLEQRGETVPLVVTEWYCGDEHPDYTEAVVDALKWYNEEASEDYFFWAACPFTLGTSLGWQHTDYGHVYEGGLLDYLVEIKDRQNRLPPGYGEGE